MADHLAPLMLMPAKSGVCPACAVDHDSEAPHDQQSLHYQYWFFFERGRWPAWTDAWEHCSEPVQLAWAQALEGHGIYVCPTQGCPGDGRYSPPGRGHIRDCRGAL